MSKIHHVRCITLSLCRNSRWLSHNSPFARLELLRCPATSVGDAMRDLDRRGLITGDFVLVMGDLISNLNLDAALSKHKARREKDPNAIMTMVLREAGKDHRSKPQIRRPFFFIDPQHARCLHYEEMSKPERGDRRLHLDSDLLAKPEIDIRGDLVDCSIDICTLDILGLWTDNFDYKSLRSSFLRGVLQDYELNGKTIHTHIVEEGYAARVSSLRAYNAASKDVISRWTYPFTPDCNLTRGHKYRLSKNKIYLEAGVVLARGSVVKARSILGKDTSVGDGSTITDSVIGRRCQIGRNVTIRKSYIWDDVVIGDNSTIDSAMIADEAVLGHDCVLQPGTLLSYRVRLSNSISLEPKTRLNHTRRPSKPDVSPPSNFSLVGPGGAGSIYHDSDSEPSSPFPSPMLSSRRSSTASASSISTLHSTSSSPSFLPPGLEIGSRRRDSATSLPSSASIASPTLSRPTGSAAAFLAEAVSSIQDGILKNDDPDTVKLELLSQRLSYDASDAAMRDAIAKALIRAVFALMNPSPAAQGTVLSSSPGAGLPETEGREPLSAKEATNRVMKNYSSILVQLGLFDDKAEEKKDQVAVLKIIEAECETRLKDGSGPGDRVLFFSLDALHRDAEVLEDEGVLQWWDSGVEKDVRRFVGGYVKLVREAESESESEESGEEEEEEDDE